MASRHPSNKTRKLNTIAAGRAAIGERKRARTRTIILGAAFEVLGNDSAQFPRVEDICAAAEISRSTFYNHFNSIEDLFEGLSHELNHRFNVSVLRAAALVEHAGERAALGMRHYLERARLDPKWARAMIKISMSGKLFGRETYDAARTTVQRGISNGEFSVREATTGRDLILGSCLAFLVSQLQNPSRPVLASSMVRSVMRGLGVTETEIDRILRLPLTDLTASALTDDQ